MASSDTTASCVLSPFKCFISLIIDLQTIQYNEFLTKVIASDFVNNGEDPQIRLKLTGV